MGCPGTGYTKQQVFEQELKVYRLGLAFDMESGKVNAILMSFCFLLYGPLGRSTCIS